MAHPENVGLAESLLEEIGNFSIDDLISRPQWGELNFNDAAPSIREIRELASLIQEFGIEKLPNSPIKNIVHHLTQARDQLQQINGFSIAKDNSNQDRNTLSAAVVKAADDLASVSGPWLAFAAMRAGSLVEAFSAQTEVTKQLEEIVDATTLQMGQAQTEAEQILTSLRATAGKGGVAAYSQDFSIKAKTARTESWWWLGGTIGLALITAVFAIFYQNLFSLPLMPEVLEDGSKEEFWAHSISLAQYSVTKFFVLGLLLTLTLWCGSLFRTAKHQETINAHKAHSLSTFETFVGASNDPAVRDAVLMETTRAIFGIPPTGYVKNEGDNSQGGHIFEWVRQARGQSHDE